MAIFDGIWTHKGLEIQRWMDPKRYRVKISGRSPRHPEIFSAGLKTLHDADPRRGVVRALAWIDKYRETHPESDDPKP